MSIFDEKPILKNFNLNRSKTCVSCEAREAEPGHDYSLCKECREELQRSIDRHLQEGE